MVIQASSSVMTPPFIRAGIPVPGLPFLMIQCSSPYFGPFSLRDTRLQWVGLGSGPSCRTQQGNGDYVAYCHDYTHTSHDSSLMMTTDITAKWLLRLHARGRKCRKT